MVLARAQAMVSFEQSPAFFASGGDVEAGKVSAAAGILGASAELGRVVDHMRYLTPRITK